MFRWQSTQEERSRYRRRIALALENHPEIETLVVTAEYVFTAQRSLSPEEKSTLTQILKAQETAKAIPHQVVFWVFPRKGTYSSWGSKALDICHHAGIDSIDRLEMGFAFYVTFKTPPLASTVDVASLGKLFYDRMTESLIQDEQSLSTLFEAPAKTPIRTFDLVEQGQGALDKANRELGLALSSEEMEFLSQAFLSLERNPTDVELMMFAQINSEHCRHKNFNAAWEIDGEKKAKSLFGMIKNTYNQAPENILSAYKDNAAVMESFAQSAFVRNQGRYQFSDSHEAILMKVETHNHPTAIEPFAGSGTGQGGEIRDEGATGRGSQPKVGLVGFTVSNLNLPNFPMPWETQTPYPTRIQNALDIMLKAPLGGAAFNNEFGRPCIVGYFRTYEQPQTLSSQKSHTHFAYGYHKPVMIAGGMGRIDPHQVHKHPLQPGNLLIILGGPAMKIGIGGGSASSMAQGQSKESLDFASVQRQNPEMQRRAQEVIEHCRALKENNPILSIHDVGAGGIANALSELVHDHGLGAHIELQKISVADLSMNPLEVWCNESQERYVLALDPKDLDLFEQIARRERCPYAVVGEATEKQHITVYDLQTKTAPVDLPCAVLFASPPRLQKKLNRTSKQLKELSYKFDLSDVLTRVLQCPTVADKSFLITIGDRTVTGLVARDQLVGPWQIPVADCGVSASTYTTLTGESMAMGERPALSLIDAKRSARMSVGEAILNILSSDIEKLSDIKLSCNWMADAKSNTESLNLYDAVETVGESFCPILGIAVPVGKDSLSMQTQWQTAEKSYQVQSPLTLVVSAFAPVKNITQTLTAYVSEPLEQVLCLVDLSGGNQRLGASIFAQVTQQIGNDCPDADPHSIRAFAQALKQAKQKHWVTGYHDRSDGGLWATLCEIAFASHSGVTVDLSGYAQDGQQGALKALLNEELGVVLSIPKALLHSVKALFESEKLGFYEIAQFNDQDLIQIKHQNKILYHEKRITLQSLWSEVSLRMKILRDDSACAKEEFQKIAQNDPGFSTAVTPKFTLRAPDLLLTNKARPKVAILREQGVNGHQEMAAAFTLAGFEAIDVTMQDLMNGQTLEGFHGLAVCGGFSYGDVLGAGLGWANAIVHVPKVLKSFSDFFERANTFTLGVCNGCQMLSYLKEVIPGAEHWPNFVQNRSQQFEARLALVEVTPSPSILFKEMTGWIVPIAVAHGEGQVIFTPDQDKKRIQDTNLLSLRYVNTQKQPAVAYPDNPNGSLGGMTGFTTPDGRVTIMMPHPERVFKSWQCSWAPSTWARNNREGYSPWMQLFYNAKLWLANNVKI